jgi:hypothetical protein
MVAKLNQIIAIEKGTKAKAISEISTLYKLVQKNDLFNGFTKTYQPLDEDDTEKLPSESKRVQATVTECLARFSRAMSELVEVSARRDYTNCTAFADVKVDGKVIFAKAPTPFLLFMEKQLTDLHTFVGSLPTLDEGEEWTRDPNSGLEKAKSTQTHRTKKTQKPVVLYPATQEHPAQTSMVTEDVIAGHWTQVKQSGAVARTRKSVLLERVVTLLNAVKQAREEANMADEVQSTNAEEMFKYIFE